MFISSIKEIINELKNGKMIIIIDEIDRENEGDLLLMSDFISIEYINFMISYGKGLLCLTTTKKHYKKLNLNLISEINKSRFNTNFITSLESKYKTNTGISSKDRFNTIRIFSNNFCLEEDIIKPGHIFPILSKNKGILSRPGHTESGFTLSNLLKLTNSSVICEILNSNGSSAKLNDLIKFSNRYNIKICSIKNLISYIKYFKNK